ncbi:aldehyde dehydrogenase [Anabaena sp. CCY 9402-a]|uniref:aldehyde dehydrogenase n=1 Tax=Anabaena sp. CCY 9402-a TaxID=3103867 RepID=UPI0039C634BD
MSLHEQIHKKIIMDNLKIQEIIHKQRQFFQTGQTKDIAFRLDKLRILKQLVKNHEQEIIQALKADLNKPEFEAYATEIFIIKEINYAIKHLKNWCRPQKTGIPLEFIQYSAQIHPEPLGIVLIIGAWNYPFQLIIAPLLGAIAAGNCAMIKPSELAPHTSNLLCKLINKYFSNEYISIVEGEIEISQQLLAEKFDHIFFTGSTSVGKIVMMEAAKTLTPVTLELGGKSPCIVDTDINLENTARRIIWGKFLNAGQTCIAPDYLLVNQAIKKDLILALKTTITEFYGDNPAKSPDYCKIINEKHFERLSKLLNNGKIIIGGDTNPEELYISPTLIDHVSLADSIMQEEIFGPILPIIEYTDIETPIALINSQPKPLALYLFSRNQNLQKHILQTTSSGGVCINDIALQFAVSSLPFGGVGNSGIGSYHGKASFDTFSHYKSVLKNSFWLDINWRYAPYKGKLSLLKLIIK